MTPFELIPDGCSGDDAEQFPVSLSHLDYLIDKMPNASQDERDHLIEQASNIVECLIYSPKIVDEVAFLNQSTPTMRPQG